jgi:hypothetical protein
MIGAGRADLPQDRHLIKAFTLVATEWKPSRWEDIGSLPDQVVRDYWAIREGQAAQREGHRWYRVTGRGVVLAHLYGIEPDGPGLVARCGEPREPGVTYARSDTPPTCQRCTAIASGQPTSIGTIGDLDVELAGG